MKNRKVKRIYTSLAIVGMLCFVYVNFLLQVEDSSSSFGVDNIVSNSDGLMHMPDLNFIQSSIELIRDMILLGL